MGVSGEAMSIYDDPNSVEDVQPNLMDPRRLAATTNQLQQQSNWLMNQGLSMVHDATNNGGGQRSLLANTRFDLNYGFGSNEVTDARQLVSTLNPSGLLIDSANLHQHSMAADECQMRLISGGNTAAGLLQFERTGRSLADRSLVSGQSHIGQPRQLLQTNLDGSEFCHIGDTNDQGDNDERLGPIKRGRQQEQQRQNFHRYSNGLDYQSPNSMTNDSDEHNYSNGNDNDRCGGHQSVDDSGLIVASGTSDSARTTNEMISQTDESSENKN